MESLSQLSVMSSQTAHDISTLPFDPLLTVEVSLDGTLLDHQFALHGNRILFKMDGGHLRVDQTKTRQGTRKVTVQPEWDAASEWKWLVQMRIRTGRFRPVKVVDKDVFEFSTRSKPIAVDIVDNSIRSLRFEIRSVNRFVLPLPTYESGDRCVVFSDGPPLWTYSGLLALVSPYFRDMLASLAPSEAIDLSPFPRDDFLALLNQLHPTGKPLQFDFQALCRASTAFHVRFISVACARNLVEMPALGFLIRIKMALDLDLTDALEELVFRAAQTGVWHRMISTGWDPHSLFGPNIYSRIVLPAVMRAKQCPGVSTVLSAPRLAPSDLLVQPANDQLPFTTTIILMGTRFYVNSGVLASHGCSGFGTSPSGELVANVLPLFRHECSLAGVSPGQVVESLLLSLYPAAPFISGRLVRPALAFAIHHNMHFVAATLEQAVILEPCVDAQSLLSHLKLADRLDLVNLHTARLHGSEGAQNAAANALLADAGMAAQLSPETRAALMDRVCSGWGLELHGNRCSHPLLRKQGTSFVERVVDLVDGGPIGMERYEKHASFHGSINSDVAFGDVKENAIIA